MKIIRIPSSSSSFPKQLKIVTPPPNIIYTAGTPLREILDRPKVAVVGSRRVSSYGRQVTIKLVQQLAEQGIVIISGLAIGVDAIAHRACLDAGGTTIAVMPSGLDRLYPASNANLGKRILEQGGALLSEYESTGEQVYKMNFIARNRLIAGLADAVLITEAAANSGSLHTSDFALDQGKDVFAVPGNITSPVSAGTNNLIKTGAHAVTEARDILEHFDIIEAATKPQPRGSNPFEQTILSLMEDGTSDSDELLIRSNLSVPDFSQTMTMLEITGKIQPIALNHWALH